jgi:hypothetical protein
MAQLGARLNGIEKVESSNLSGSTNYKSVLFKGAFFAHGAAAPSRGFASRWLLRSTSQWH